MQNIILSSFIYFLAGLLATFDDVICDRFDHGLRQKQSKKLDQLLENHSTAFVEEKKGNKDDAYQLQLTSSSPAVLDSILNFQARLLLQGKDVPDKTLFRYIWKNDANDHSLTSEDNYESRINEKSFRSYFIDPGVYRMHVKVYRNSGLFQRPTQVAHGSINFNLTRYLNGRLQTIQHLRYKKEKLTFATKKPLNLSSILTDRFESNYTYAYIWYVNGTFQEWNQTHGNITYYGPVPGNLNITVKVKASNSIGFDPMNKEGTFTKIIMLKDEINITNVTGEGQVEEGQPVIVNVTYNGSNPTDICWHVIKVNSSVNCTRLFGNTDKYSIHLPSEDEPGTYEMNISVENAVSQVRTQTSFIVVHNKGPSKSSPVIAVTVTFCVIGIIVTALALAYGALRSRKTAHTTETADFNFHPNIRASQSTLNAVKNLFNQFLERGRFDGRGSLVQSSQRTVTYGSLESSTEEKNILL